MSFSNLEQYIRTTQAQTARVLNALSINGRAPQQVLGGRTRSTVRILSRSTQYTVPQIVHQVQSVLSSNRLKSRARKVDRIREYLFRIRGRSTDAGVLRYVDNLLEKLTLDDVAHSVVAAIGQPPNASAPGSSGIKWW